MIGPLNGIGVGAGITPDAVELIQYELTADVKPAIQTEAGPGTAQIGSNADCSVVGTATTGPTWNSVCKLDQAVWIAVVRFITKIDGAGTGALIAACN